MKNLLNKEQLYIGVDGGGTKCCACVCTSDFKLLGAGIGGPANAFHSEEQAKSSIINAVELALAEAALPTAVMGEAIVGIGLAGVNVPVVFESMNAWQHPFKKMYLTTDLHIACLGAHNQDKGAVIVAGTGSCGYSFVGGVATMIGGHGFLLGDKGSGAWLGMEAVKAVLLAQDDLGPQTLLSKFICEQLKATGIMIVEKLAAAKSSDYAQLAHFVFDAANQRDEIALKILLEGAGYIDELAKKLWETNPGRMSIIGGLSQTIIPWLKPETINNLSAPINSPELGAVYFAMQQYS